MRAWARHPDENYDSASHERDPPHAQQSNGSEFAGQ